MQALKSVTIVVCFTHSVFRLFVHKLNVFTSLLLARKIHLLSNHIVQFSRCSVVGANSARSVSGFRRKLRIALLLLLFKF